jgi:outer membrane receptor protein involved in Fe transport
MTLSRRPGIAIAFLCVAAGLVSSPTAQAQGNVGVIDGRVLDQSRAAIPGATVTAKNVATGLVRSAVVSATGTYRVTALPAGTYDVTAALTGFSSQVTKAVEVRVGNTVTVDFSMKVGAMTETIEVVGETPLVQATTSDVGQVITQKMVENIPLNGRKFQDLSLLVPGTRPSNYYDPTKTEVGGISYGGLTGRSVIINVDGGDNNDGVVRGLLQQFSADAIQEYKVTTQRYSAEYGRSVGGVVNVVTKSGTNDLHGTAFVFGRNQSLNARDYFQEQQDTEKPPFKQWQFGATLGGPIVKDKAHYFLSYERNNRDDYSTVDTGGILPSEEGNFAQPFRNNLLTAKLDFTLGSNNSLVARYTLEDQKRDHDFIGGNTLASSGATNTNKIHSVILKDTAVMGTSKINELLVLFQHFENNILAEDPSVPAIITPDFNYGANSNTPQQTIQKRWQIRDDFSFRKQGWGGDHQFKVGAEILKSHYGGFFLPNLYGYFNFATSLGGDINSYLNGIADTFSGSAGNNVADDNWTYVAGYVQDDWKPSSRLTLNLGLRYEIQYGPYSNDFNTPALRAVGAAGYDNQRKNDTNNLGPRIGFAYDVKGDASLVARGGYGRYYDEIFQNITLYERWSDAATPLNFVSVSPAPFTPNQYAANADAIRNSFLDPTFAGQLTRLTAPDLKQPSADQYNLGVSAQVSRYFAFDVDYVHAVGHDEVHRWRINTPQNLSTRVSPAGVFSPADGPFNVEGNRGHSKFDGVYVTGKVRHAKATVIATYAWSKAMNIANDFNTVPSDITNQNFEVDWGPTPNDVRHRGTLGAVLQLPALFQLSTAVQANSGKPYSALAGLSGLRASVRATDPATGQPFPRNSFRADGFFSWDVRLSKMFNFGKSRQLEALFEVFNLTNHANFDRDNYVFTYSSSNFGNPTNVLKNSQRQAEFGLRFRF